MHLGREVFRGPKDETQAALMVGSATGTLGEDDGTCGVRSRGRLSSRCGQRPLPAGRIMMGIWRQARWDARIEAEAR